MSSIERIGKMDEVRAWRDNIPIESHYTVGIAGERFLRAIKDRGVLLGATCPECQITYLPPSLFCERCFSELKEWVEVENLGTVDTYTILWQDMNDEPLEEPEIMALVNINGTYGGLVHRLGEVKREDLYIGMPVRAVLKPKKEREGSVLDIRYFKPC